jgi:hypothetical protein
MGVGVEVQLFAFLTSVMDEWMDVNGEAQRTAAIPQTAPIFHHIGCWVHPGASQGVLEMGKSLASARTRIK